MRQLSKACGVALFLLVSPILSAAELPTQLVIDNQSNCSLVLLEKYAERNAQWQPPSYAYAHRATTFSAVIDQQADTGFEPLRASARYEIHCGRILVGELDLKVYGQQALIVGVELSPVAPIKPQANQAFVSWKTDASTRVVLVADKPVVMS